jgi:hypothetical protein
MQQREECTQHSQASSATNARNTHKQAAQQMHATLTSKQRNKCTQHSQTINAMFCNTDTLYK